jgi:hypothetical protein
MSECDQLVEDLPTSIELSTIGRSIDIPLSPLNDETSQQSESQLLTTEDICEESLTQSHKSLNIDNNIDNNINDNNSNIDINININNSSINCYCDKDRDLNVVELQCYRCLKWFHINCIHIQIGRCLPFMTCYTFLCKYCSPQQMESFTRRQTSLVLIHLLIHYLLFHILIFFFSK